MSSKDISSPVKQVMVSEITGKRKKNYKPTSPVWEHFTKDPKSDKAQCNYCPKVFACPASLGTSTLWRHLDKCPKYPKNKDKRQKLITFTQNGEHGSLSNWKFDQESCRKELARMIIADELPFKFVEHDGFKKFLNTLQPKFQVVSRKTIRKDCLAIYSAEKLRLKNVFESSPSQVCLTTDLWTSIQNLGYMCLTAHYIDENWTLQKKIINFPALPTPHRGENIAQAVEACLTGWGIEKVLTITVDNASSNDVAVSMLKTKLNRKKKLLFDGDMFHMRCFAHILNLVVKDGIDEVGISVTRIRESIKYVRSSPSRLQLFKKCVVEEGIMSKSSLCLDVQTRWNSTYLMLTAAIKYQKAFDRLEEQDPTFVNEAIRRNGTVSEDDWKNARNLHRFLEYFYDMTKRVSGSKYVTSNTYFHEVYSIQSILLKWSCNQDGETFLCDMAKKMQTKFDKYCRIDKVNPLMLIAVVLDPRYKLELLEFCFSKFHTHLEVDKLMGNVKVLLERLFHHYSVLEAPSVAKVTSCETFVVKTHVRHVNAILNESKDEWNKFLKEKASTIVKSDLDRYLEGGLQDSTSDFNILDWWKERAATHPIVSRMARDILAIPVTTVASESAFSVGGRILDPFRSSLTPTIVECLICTQDWLRSSQAPIEVEESLDELEEIESGIDIDNENVIADSST